MEELAEELLTVEGWRRRSPGRRRLKVGSSERSEAAAVGVGTESRILYCTAIVSVGEGKSGRWPSGATQRRETLTAVLLFLFLECRTKDARWQISCFRLADYWEVVRKKFKFGNVYDGAFATGSANCEGRLVCPTSLAELANHGSPRGAHVGGTKTWRREVSFRF